MDIALPAAEKAKLDARFLHGTLRDELENDAAEFSKPATAVLKFHGIYQQDDRDLRKSGTKQITAMIRVGIPGGILTPQQYLVMDRLADLGNETLRITTRQAIQFHYIPKSRLRELMRGLNENYLTSLAACGDVVRNVVSCPAPLANEARPDIRPFVLHLSKNLKPKTSAYYDVWINDEKVVSVETPENSFEVEPLYGATYLPRKFKIAFAFEGDNTTDVYANDIGVVAHSDGFTILAGGGMGQSAGVKASHPRLADPICDLPLDSDLLLKVASAIVSIHRDYGNRNNRKLARLKYVLDDWGVERFRAELVARVGQQLPLPRLLAWQRSSDYLGWHPQAGGKFFYGLRVISGRIGDFPAGPRLRTAIREIVQHLQCEVRLTAQQNLYFVALSEQDRPLLEKILRQYGVVEGKILPPVLRHALACPALPTCALAITESERIMPDVVAEIQQELNSAGLSRDEVSLRTSGCPNGCSRPYTAEIGIVGASLNMYTLYLGAAPHGTRLGSVFATNVKRNELAVKLRPVFEHFKTNRTSTERFGDFCHRIGITELQHLPAPQPVA